jgi:hypothetical protein
MGLAPMAVVAHRQHSGIGTLLVRAGLEACKEIGAGAVVVLGHPDYYPRFGFVPAVNFAIGCEYAAPAEAFHGGGVTTRLSSRRVRYGQVSRSVRQLVMFDAPMPCVPLEKKARLNRGPDFLFLSQKFGYTMRSN